MNVKISANVKHNGNWHEPGKELKKMKKEDGERLISLGVAEEVQETEAEKKARQEEADRLAAQKADAEAEAKKKAADKKDESGK